MEQASRKLTGQTVKYCGFLYKWKSLKDMLKDYMNIRRLNKDVLSWLA